MLDLVYRCVRHDLAGNGKFVFWQFGDEHFASRDGVRSCENTLKIGGYQALLLLAGRVVDILYSFQ